MPFSDAESILRALLAAHTPRAVQEVLQEIGDTSDIALDVPLAPFSFSWHAFGDNPSNISSIGLASKAGRSLTERLTNAVDATLEERALSGVPLPDSPRVAAQQWFGRPVSGPETGLYKWEFGAQGLDRKAAVVLTESEVPAAPTIDVIDEGVGLAPDAFPSTILSLQAGNKIRKRYLIGAFGQGGASTLAFSEYAIIVSRSVTNPRLVGFTVIRVVRLDATYKEDCYAYLSQVDAAGNRVVPSCQVDGPLEIYPNATGMRVPQLQHGTIVRHVAFKLSGIDGQLGPSPGNLYHYLHASLFDPLLPFRVIDLRSITRPKDELVTGSRNRLMRLVEARTPTASEEQDTGSKIRHYRAMEFVVPHGGQEPVIGIEYWVVFNFRKGRTEADPPVLRGESNELFVEKGFPIIGTLNGQNQGELRAKLVRDLGRILQDSDTNCECIPRRGSGPQRP